MAAGSDSHNDSEPDLRRTEPVDDPDVIHRLVSKADIDDYDDCWIWDGTKTNGYGYIKYKGTMVIVHRLMLRVVRNTPIPPGLDTDHTCGTKACLNPDHLQLLGRSEHVREEHRRALDSNGSAKAGLIRGDIHEIRRRYADEDVYQRELAEEYGISVDMVSRIVNRESYWYID